MRLSLLCSKYQPEGWTKHTLEHPNECVYLRRTRRAACFIKCQLGDYHFCIFSANKKRYFHLYAFMDSFETTTADMSFVCTLTLSLVVTIGHAIIVRHFFV